MAKRTYANANANANENENSSSNYIDSNHNPVCYFCHNPSTSNSQITSKFCGQYSITFHSHMSGKIACFRCVRGLKVSVSNCCIPLHFTSLHFTSLHFTSLHFTSLHQTEAKDFTRYNSGIVIVYVVLLCEFLLLPLLTNQHRI